LLTCDRFKPVTDDKLLFCSSVGYGFCYTQTSREHETRVQKLNQISLTYKLIQITIEKETEKHGPIC